MVAKQFNSVLEAVRVSCDDDRNLQLDVDDEAEETLSLCDLAENNISAEEDYSWNDQQSSSSDQDFFEFFSEDFTAATYLADNIIFCGKLIPHKDRAVPEQTQITNTAINLMKQREVVLQKKRVFAWKKSQSFSKSRTTSSKAKRQDQKTNKPLSSLSYEYKVSTRALASTPSIKSRWYLFAFGYGRFPTEMELRDIKNRQTRRNINLAATMFRFEDNNGRDQIINKRSSQKSGKSLWRLLRGLGFKTRQANTVVKAWFGLRFTCLRPAGSC